MGGLSHLRHHILSIPTPTPKNRVAISSLRTLQLQLFKLSSKSQIQRRSSSVGASSNMEPPQPKKVKHEMEMFGDARVDNYYWLRDDSRSHPDVLEHLRQENAYVDHIMSGLFSLSPSISPSSLISWILGFCRCYMS